MEGDGLGRNKYPVKGKKSLSLLERIFLLINCLNIFYDRIIEDRQNLRIFVRTV